MQVIIVDMFINVINTEHLNYELKKLWKNCTSEI